MGLISDTLYLLISSGIITFLEYNGRIFCFRKHKKLKVFKPSNGFVIADIFLLRLVFFAFILYQRGCIRYLLCIGLTAEQF